MHRELLGKGGMIIGLASRRRETSVHPRGNSWGMEIIPVFGPGSFESSKTYGRSLLSGDRPCGPKRALKTGRADRSGLLEVVGDQLGHFEHRHLTLAPPNPFQFFFCVDQGAVARVLPLVLLDL